MIKTAEEMVTEGFTLYAGFNGRFQSWTGKDSDGTGVIAIRDSETGNCKFFGAGVSPDTALLVIFGVVSVLIELVSYNSSITSQRKTELTNALVALLT